MTQLWVERTGTRRYTGYSSRGAQVLVGSADVDGVFTPGELMKIALAACSGMASDQPLARRLGDGYQAVLTVSGAADRDQERYPLLEETLQLDLTGLSADEKERVLLVVNRAVDRVCTVGRTLKSGTTVTFEVVDASSTSAPDVRLTAWVHGRVQGVGFRWWTRCRALELGLTGYAANHADGRVLVVAQGPRESGEQLLQLLRGGATPGRVDQVVADWSEATEQFSGFVER
ncbi:acylphosphatase [Mycobacterium simiae]|uniref:acylphosphatase n=1 Tax=Mycobacterium simiae TaxID=1784 RepID=A0A5B1BUM8_MYCSI|nr:acylphosphatase [Mycobacterium simiae]